MSENELTVLAEIPQGGVVTSFVNGYLKAVDCPQKIRVMIDIAVDEIFSNIVRYAYRGQNPGPVTVRIGPGETPASVSITFIDWGRPYDPLSSQSPDTTLPAKKRRVGGLGLFMVKRTMDELVYEYRDGMNFFTIRKNLQTQPPASEG